MIQSCQLARNIGDWDTIRKQDYTRVSVVPTLLTTNKLFTTPSPSPYASPSLRWHHHRRGNRCPAGLHPRWPRSKRLIDSEHCWISRQANRAGPPAGQRQKVTQGQQRCRWAWEKRQPKQEANDAKTKGFAVETKGGNIVLLVQRVHPNDKSQWWFLRQLSTAFSADRSKLHALVHGS